MRKFELIPTNGRKSFYGKAVVVIDDNGNETLYSYGTPIITISPTGEKTRLFDGWTAATGTHIKSFCGLNKKQFFEL